jgi:hypothetical protein
MHESTVSGPPVCALHTVDAASLCPRVGPGGPKGRNLADSSEMVLTLTLTTDDVHKTACPLVR